MTRLRFLLAFVALALTLGMAPVAFAQDAPAEDTPAVVVEDAAPVETEDAWTFRFLVPTVLALSALGLAATLIAYRVRLRSRYRLVR